MEIHYLVAAALRGPDVLTPATGILKEEITCRIRAICKDDIEGCLGYVVNIPLGVNDIRVIETQLKTLEPLRPNWHFVSHLSVALKYCKNHPIWGSNGEELYELLRSESFRLACYSLVKT